MVCLKNSVDQKKRTLDGDLEFCLDQFYETFPKDSNSAYALFELMKEDLCLKYRFNNNSFNSYVANFMGKYSLPSNNINYHYRH